MFKNSGNREGCTVLYNILQEKRDIILGIANKHGIKNVQVFGSVARLEDNSASDIDLLLKFDNVRSFLNLIRFKQEVEDLMKKKVDVVTEKAIHWSMKKDLLNVVFQL